MRLVFFLSFCCIVKKLAIILLLYSACGLTAQDKINLVFNETTHEFGSIDASERAVAVFSFVNVSAKPVYIYHIEETYGCYIIYHSRRPVITGATGTVTVQYNHLGNYGKFDKSIYVKVSNGTDNRTLEFKLTGNILPSADNNKDKFVYRQDGLAFREMGMDIGAVIKGFVANKSFEIYNYSSKPIRLDFSNIPNFIYITNEGERTIGPEETVKINVKYDSGKAKYFGLLTSNILLKINKKNEVKFPIKANIKEDFSSVSVSDFHNKPEIRITPDYINLGEIESGKLYKTKLKIENRGSSPLKIHNIIAPTHTTYSKPKNNVLGPEQSVILELTIEPDTTNIFSEEQFIRIISNDCTNPILDVYIQGWSISSVFYK